MIISLNEYKNELEIFLAGFRAAALGERIAANEVGAQGETSPFKKTLPGNTNVSHYRAIFIFHLSVFNFPTL